MQGLCLGFDYGRARIGVAVGQSLTCSASPQTTIACRDGDPDWQALDELVAQWDPAQLVVGLPLQLDGTEGELCAGARAFARGLAERYGRPVALADERLTSHAATDRFRGQRQRGEARRKHAVANDALAAAVILEQWLAEATPQGDDQRGGDP